MWISSIVPVRKKNGQIRVCVDFRDLNNACPKDDFPLPIAELMIDATTGHEALSFMDGSSGYNQIRMAPTDEELTAFRTPKNIYCYRVMPFGLKNAGATYQRAMQRIFDDMLHKNVECYVDYLVVKSKKREDHLYDLRKERSVGILLAQNNDEGKENALYYFCRTMTPNELKYSPIEKLCLALIFAIQKLKHYFQSHNIHLVSKANPLKRHNKQADALAKLASILSMTNKEALIPICKSWVIPPDFSEDEEDLLQEEKNHVMEVFEVEEEDWRHPLVDYLKYGKLPNDPRRRINTRWRATRFIYYKGTLYKWSFEGIFLHCLSDDEKDQATEEAYSGVCGAHQSGPKLHFRIKRMGYYWPTMVKDCIDYAKRCQACQFHANLIHQPLEPLHPTVAS
ncbi:UNVERIFIED_CONTAM: Transposon Tf2-11 polyprotein [Sesamum radiatum]|uniref:Transposon Tf2-11 polyprotein n=1 Tax=Sesamum radiatum TaxID=300843 RepID=A0AAW2REP9_SESRA